MEYKSLPLELDSLSLEKGTATIAHSVYNSIDLVDDIALRGMFTKTWQERKQADGSMDIMAYVNHDDTQAFGRVLRTHDNETKAFTDVKAGTHTLGRDTLIQMDEKIIRKASFGFETKKRKFITKEKKQIRQLQEVDHLETSVLTRLSAHPSAGVVKVNKHYINTAGIMVDIKSLDQNEQAFLSSMIRSRQGDLEKIVAFSGGLDVTSDLYTTMQYWISQLNSLLGDMKSNVKYNTKSVEHNMEVKDHLENLRKFVRNTKASDGAIIDAELEIKALEEAFQFDTDDTLLITEPTSSEGDSETKQLADELILLTLKLF